MLLLIFAAAITNSMARGRRPDCNCFGNLHSAPAGGSTLARNLALAGLAGLVLWRGPGTELDAWVEARSTAELATLGASVTALAFAVLSLSLWSQKRRLVQALADARRATIDALTAAPVKPEGLPVGTIAPESELVTLRGEQRSLASLRAGGRPAVLVFLDPGCGPCHGLVPHVSRWQAALNERLAITVISEGSPDRVRAAWRGHATEVLLDTDTTVTRGAYGMVTWPSAMAIGADGRVAHEVVHSQDGMEALIRTMLERTSPPPRTRASGSDASLLTADDIP